MFCPTCQQDVPALAVPEEPGVVRCAFCAEELGLGEREQEVGVRSQESERLVLVSAGSETRAEQMETSERRSAEPLGRLPLPPKPILDDWDLDPEMRAAERMLKGLRQTAPGSVEMTHAAHEDAQSWHMPVRIPPEPQRPAAQASQEKSGSLAWTCLSLGVMALACGLVLIGWSLVEERGDLWSLGLPLAIFGQGALVIGLLMQLEGLWRNSKRTQETLTQLDGKLSDLAHTTTMLGTTRSSPAQSFYVHLAEGASPHLLLADLKGQLDLLAERMARK